MHGQTALHDRPAQSNNPATKRSANPLGSLSGEIMKSRYAPSPTFLLHVAVVLAGAGAAFLPASTPARLAPAPRVAAAQEIQLQSPAAFRLGVHAGRELPAGSRWRAMGSLEQGTVYRPLNQVVVVEGRRVNEAYPVVQGNRLQGFFLPGEAAFSAVKPIMLSL
jgi:hypothetical protein